MLVKNYIDACAIYRKKCWEEVGGYDENMPYQGKEDWDFWIAFGIRGFKFHHIKEITFKYRVSNSSMMTDFLNKCTVRHWIIYLGSTEGLIMNIIERN